MFPKKTQLPQPHVSLSSLERHAESECESKSGNGRKLGCLNERPQVLNELCYVHVSTHAANLGNTDVRNVAPGATNVAPSTTL